MRNVSFLAVNIQIYARCSFWDFFRVLKDTLLQGLKSQFFVVIFFNKRHLDLMPLLVISGFFFALVFMFTIEIFQFITIKSNLTFSKQKKQNLLWIIHKSHLLWMSIVKIKKEFIAMILSPIIIEHRWNRVSVFTFWEYVKQGFYAQKCVLNRYHQIDVTHLG